MLSVSLAIVAPLSNWYTVSEFILTYNKYRQVKKIYISVFYYHFCRNFVKLHGPIFSSVDYYTNKLHHSCRLCSNILQTTEREKVEEVCLSPRFISCWNCCSSDSILGDSWLGGLQPSGYKVPSCRLFCQKQRCYCVHDAHSIGSVDITDYHRTHTDIPLFSEVILERRERWRERGGRTVAFIYQLVSQQ